MKEIKVLLIVAAAVTSVLAFRWMGQNAAMLSAGIGEAFKVLMAGTVLAGIGGLAWWRWTTRQEARRGLDGDATRYTATPLQPARTARQIPPRDLPELPPGTCPHCGGISGEDEADRQARAWHRGDR